MEHAATDAVSGGHCTTMHSRSKTVLTISSSCGVFGIYFIPNVYQQYYSQTVVLSVKCLFCQLFKNARLPAADSRRNKQLARLSQRSRAMLRVIEYFAKLFKVT